MTYYAINSLQILWGFGVLASIFWILVIGAFIVLIIYTLTSVAKPVSKKTGNNRRKKALIIWAIVIAAIALNYSKFELSNWRGNRAERRLASSYAKSYAGEVFLPVSKPYRVGFDGKWGYPVVHITNSTKTHLFLDADDFTIEEIPITDIVKNYFDPAEGHCDFNALRKNNNDKRSNETCVKLAQENGFDMYYSSLKRYYAVKNSTALSIEKYSGTRTHDEVFQIARDLMKVTNLEFAQVAGSSRYDGQYPEVIDRWHKEGRF